MAKQQQQQSQPRPQPSRMSEVSFDQYSQPPNEETASIPDHVTMTSDSDGEGYAQPMYGSSSRKRKRGANKPQAMTTEDQQHLIWSDELLDYFMLQRSEEHLIHVPIPPQDVDLNRAVDEKGNTALHWASAMGDINLVQEFVSRGAKVDSLTHTAATPLMHAVTFTNNADKKSFGRLVDYLYPTVGQRDCCLSTVFHHIVVSTMSKSKYPVARYYLECILDRLKQSYDQGNVAQLLDVPDSQGNTAVLLAAKYGARKCVRLLTAHGANITIPNNVGETAETYIRELNERRRDRYRHGSSSPVLAANGISHLDGPGPSFQGVAPYSQQRSSPFSSEAASFLIAQLPTLIATRSDALASSLDVELHEKDAEAHEGVRLLQQRREELTELHSRVATLSSQDEDEAVDEGQQAELEELMVESRRLIEAEQADELRRLIAEVETHEAVVDGEDGDAAWPKLSMARELQTAQTQRKRLVADIVTAQGFAGVEGERQEAYKRLVTSALGVRPDDVETMLPDIVAELEEIRSGHLGLRLLSPEVDMMGMDSNVSHAPVSVYM